MLKSIESLRKCYLFPVTSAGVKVRFGNGRHNSGRLMITELNSLGVGLFYGATPLAIIFMISIFRLHLYTLIPAEGDRRHAAFQMPSSDKFYYQCGQNRLNQNQDLIFFKTKTSKIFVMCQNNKPEFKTINNQTEFAPLILPLHIWVAFLIRNDYKHLRR